MAHDLASPELRYLTVAGAMAREGGERSMAFWDWAPADPVAAASVVVCVHGLSRQGRDFDALARVLRERSRVIAVDVAGRGESDALADPMAYQVPTYVADLATLVMHLRAETPGCQIDWVGTSMGGLIGMALAAQPALAPRRLVLNDVGPTIQWQALMRIGAYLGLNPSFDSEQAAIDYLASISSSFGPHTPEQWRALSLPMLRMRDGRWWLHYDPAIAVPFRALMDAAGAQAAAEAGEATLWPLYDAIQVPTLLLRGADSDLLPRKTAQAMAERGPRALCVEFEGVGHAPTLVVPEQIEVVRRFLWDETQ